ncbi:MAG: hypothetical protein FWC26_10340 [Fibromonadales bacterium]|nr:hypothetical protein [Fibromonadales bacterium]
MKAILVGIDFGTTFSKVCFRRGEDPEFIKFNETFFKESIVYFHNEKLYYNSTENSTPIKYFKYSIIGDELRDKKDKYESELISVFFLSCLIKESKKYIENAIGEKIEIINNMGAPIDNFIGNEKYRKIYNKIIHIAERVSELIEECYSCDLENLKYYYESLDNDEARDNVWPELYVESYSYLKNSNIGNGYYAIIDIGGGTVDFGVFEKQVIEESEHNDFYARAKEVWHNGVEVVIAKTSSESGLNEEEIRSYISEGVGNLNKKALLFLDKLKSEFKDKFVKELLVMLHEHEKLNVRRSTIMDVNVLICGGGANCKWYNDIIKNTEIGEGVHLSFSDLTDEAIPSNRLLISDALAKYLGNMPKIKGWPRTQEEVEQEKNEQRRYLEKKQEEITSYTLQDD